MHFFSVKLMKGECHQNKGINEENERHGIQTTEGTTTMTGKGSLRKTVKRAPRSNVEKQVCRAVSQIRASQKTPGRIFFFFLSQS